MAKDDYFVLVYKILAYLYQALKSGETPDFEYLSYDTKAFPICESYWNYIFEMLLKDEYISGVILVNRVGCNDPAVKFNNSLRITPKGIDYLQCNSSS